MSDKKELLKPLDAATREVVQQIAAELGVDLVEMEERLEMTILPDVICCGANSQCMPA